MGCCCYDIFMHVIFIQSKSGPRYDLFPTSYPGSTIPIDIHPVNGIHVIGFIQVIQHFCPKPVYLFLSIIDTSEIPGIYQSWPAFRFCIYTFVNIDDPGHHRIRAWFPDISFMFQILQGYMVFICIDINRF